MNPRRFRYWLGLEQAFHWPHRHKAVILNAVFRPALQAKDLFIPLPASHSIHLTDPN